MPVENKQSDCINIMYCLMQHVYITNAGNAIMPQIVCPMV